MQRHNPESSLSIGKPRQEMQPDLCVIGAGSGGLSVAAAAAGLGQSVVLIEHHKMGGDCLNYGCVPSKALIAAANRAQAVRTARRFGIDGSEPRIDRRRINDRIRSVIAAIAPNDSVERFRGLGVSVLQASARFVDEEAVRAGEALIKARRFVIATGSSPVIPSIPGLAETPYLTNETVFVVEDEISHLLVIGGGPVGLELAQAHMRLGSKVTVIEAQTALAKHDPELTAVLLEALRAEGLELLENARIERADGQAGDIRVTVAIEGVTRVITGTHLLLAAGRKANIGELGLDAARVRHGQDGIVVGPAMRTSNRRIFAIGDCVAGPQFATHAASYHAAVVIKRSLFRLPAKVVDSVIPRVIFTTPEIASVGLTEAQARERRITYKVLRWPFAENDRAQAEGTTEGHVKAVVDRKGTILGAGIVGAQAGELIHVWSLAVSQRLNIKAMADFVAPYPTLGEINKRAAFRNYIELASRPLVRKMIGWLKKLG